MKFVLRNKALLGLILLGGIGSYTFTAGRKHYQKVPVLYTMPKDYPKYNDCEIKGSKGVVFEELEKYANDNFDKNDEIVVYSEGYTCPFAYKSWNILYNAGFHNVKAYLGGMNEWHFSKLPTEGQCKEGYLAEEIKKPKKITTEIMLAPGVVTTEEAQMVKEIKKDELKKLLNIK